MTSWTEILNESVETVDALAHHLPVHTEAIEEVIQVYPMRINAYFLDLVKRKGDSLARQVVPDSQELLDTVGFVDPLAEEQNSPVPNLIHRYPDRVLFLVSSVCGVYCRFCTRKRRLGHTDAIKNKDIEKGLLYIREHREVRDVLLSGGDPLLLSDARLEWILSRVREISHVEIIRIGTRVPSVLPQRITPDLVRLLKKFHPLYINVHFNHPDELTPESQNACALLADGGIPLGNQTVLLKGINDDPEIMSDLMKNLTKIRVRPYYLHQADLVKGTDHFRTTIASGLRIMESLRERISGSAVPAYVVDLPGGGGKVPLLPESVAAMHAQEGVFKNHGRLCTYPQPSSLSTTVLT